MKKLYLVRHAKSSWDDINMDDFDRPLNERGLKDAPHMAKLLKQRGAVPNRMISSTAVRALTTCKIFADNFSFAENQIITLDRLYHASAETWFDVLRSLKEHQHNKDDVAFFFGHNPGITEFASALLRINIDNIPTCGVVSATLNINAWSETTFACGKLDSFDYPKMGE